MMMNANRGLMDYATAAIGLTISMSSTFAAIFKKEFTSASRNWGWFTAAIANIIKTLKRPSVAFYPCSVKILRCAIIYPWAAQILIHLG